MTFASGSIEALRELSSNQFDIIVTDMRMPIMNGAELLDEVRSLHPQTVRIALSGHTDRELIFQAVASTHQFLAKPCDPEVLKNTIYNCINQRHLVKHQGLKLQICQTQSVPSQPSAIETVMEALDSPEPDINRIGAIVATDIGMSAKALQLVNSAFFGAPRGACLPEQAVVLLGVESLRELFKNPQICTTFPCDRVKNLDLDEMWTHNVLTAKLSKAIAVYENLTSAQADSAYVAGLLHDVGKMILAAMEPEQYDKIAGWSGTPARNKEIEIFGESHDVIGAYLLGLWGYSPNMVEAVGWHHYPSQSVMGKSKLLTIVHAADYIAQEYAFDNEVPTKELDKEYMIADGSMDKLESWRTLAPEIMMNGVYR
jgi:putative nucleotidyltransferase with HDIG domain